MKYLHIKINLYTEPRSSHTNKIKINISNTRTVKKHQLYKISVTSDMSKINVSYKFMENKNYLPPSCLQKNWSEFKASA